MENKVSDQEIAMVIKKFAPIILDNIPTCTEKDLVPDAYWCKDLGGDSLDYIVVTMAIEKEYRHSFHIDIKPSSCRDVKLRDIGRAVVLALKERGLPVK